MTVKVIEGVPYHRYVVKFQLADGRRRRWVRWSPGEPWIREELVREFEARFDLNELAPNTCTYELS